jgi:hypothetical protein
VQLLNEYLPCLGKDEELFKFDYANTKKILNRAIERSKVTAQPKGDHLTWKDLRSGMACDLLNKGWSRDEVNSRLGHKPSSSEIDKYISFFALDKRRPKAKVQAFKTAALQDEIDAIKEQAKLQAKRSREQTEELNEKFEKLTKYYILLNNILDGMSTTNPEINKQRIEGERRIITELRKKRRE